MPSLVLTTNVKVEDVQAFVLDFSKFGAKVLGKPEVYISVQYNHNEALSFAGNFKPAFLLVITSLDNISPDVNEQYSAAFFEYFKTKLGVMDNRGYITFYDPGRANLGKAIKALLSPRSLENRRPSSSTAYQASAQTRRNFRRRHM